jgi:Bacterial Ig-like domain (group 3)
MKKISILRYAPIVACMAFPVPAMIAQNSIQLFTPVNVRASADGTGYGASAVAFNSSTLNLTCSASPIVATLSSSADNTGNVLVDNLINVTVTTGSGTSGPVNVCSGGTSDSTPNGISQNCFTPGYGSNAGQLVGQNPDTFVANGGVAPLNISGNLQSGALQLKVDLVDEGVFLASSTIYLNTNCSQGGVTGPATITGNPIPSNNPTPAELTQTFPFNPTQEQAIQFVYSLADAEAADSLTISNGTIPTTGDLPIDPQAFLTTYVPGTSFATSSCMIHTGELVGNTSVCKLFTLKCTVGTGANASGAQCPVSSMPNEVFQDIFDGPSFTLPDIPTPNGPTFHQGVGFLMASEGWTGGPCTFDPASNLQTLICPQNLLASFSGPGAYTATGHSTHPNSSFIPVAQVPEDLTTVTVTGQQPGGWINNSTANVTFSSQPPVLAGTNLPGAAAFVPSPIQSITYGTSAPGSVPVPGGPPSTPPDTVIANNIACPLAASPLDPPATVFTPAAQQINGLADGSYLLHYYAQDCAGTQELKFTQDGGGVWSTSFYTFPINVDTMAPAVATGPVLSPAPGASGSYKVGDPVTATYSCTDERSGVVRCGAYTYSPSGGLLTTGPLQTPVDTSSPGMKTYTVTAIDAAGNQSSSSVSYQVVSGYDTAIQLSLSTSTVTYPQGTNVTIGIAPTQGHTPTGSVQLFDGSTLFQTSRLQGNGVAYLYIFGLSAGSHQLKAVYAGDKFNAGGTSAPVTLTVNPVPVNLGTVCWNSNFPYGANYYCGIYTSSNAGPPQGVITYRYDGGAPITVGLQFGIALFTITKPPVGTHTISVAYAAQTNYAAANPGSSTFVVTPAPVQIQLTPSSWYLTGGNLTLNASIQSWSAGPPKALGTVAFYDGSRLLATVPVTNAGTAATTLSAASLSKGSHTFIASYSGSPNYSAGSSSVTITVATK